MHWWHIHSGLKDYKYILIHIFVVTCRHIHMSAITLLYMIIFMHMSKIDLLCMMIFIDKYYNT